MGSKGGDPFYVVKDEVEQSLVGMEDLFTKWHNILRNENTAQSDEFRWLSTELKKVVDSIEWEVKDLQETISIVEDNPDKFSIEPYEIDNRKNFVKTVQSKLELVKREMNAPGTHTKMQQDEKDSLMKTSAKQTRYAKLEQEIEGDNDKFIEGEQVKQQLIEKEQEQYLDKLDVTADTLGNIGRSISDELRDQNHMLDEFAIEVDDTNSRMKQASSKVTQLIGKLSEKTSWCIIITLIVVLVALTIIVIYLFK